MLRDVEIAVARHAVFRNRVFGGEQAAEVDELGYPCFVKPARLGSSVGISKVSGREDLGAASSWPSSTTRRCWWRR